MLDVIVFRDADGSEPFIDWLNGLRDERAVARIAARIERLGAGLFGDSKALEQGVHELRVDYGPGYRVYYGRQDKRIVLLLCGGDKGSQRRDIRRAIKYWEQWKTER